MVKIHFQESKSARFKKAVSIARKLNCSYEDKTYTIFIEKSKLLPNLQLILELTEIIQNWKSASAELYQIKTSVFAIYKLIAEIQDCHSGNLRLYRTDRCKINGHTDGWGCSRLNKIKKELPVLRKSRFNHFFNYGRFIDSETWAVNVEQVQFIIEKEIEEKALCACPLFDKGKIMKNILLLPLRIELDKNWKIEYKKELDENGKVVEKPFNIVFVVPEKTRVF